MRNWTIAPTNLVRVNDWKGADREGRTEYLYRYEMNKSGKFRVMAIYTGLATGCIGSGGKSFATAAERDVATVASIDRFLASGKANKWQKVTVSADEEL